MSFDAELVANTIGKRYLPNETHSTSVNFFSADDRLYSTGGPEPDFFTSPEFTVHNWKVNADGVDEIVRTQASSVFAPTISGGSRNFQVDGKHYFYGEGTLRDGTWVDGLIRRNANGRLEPAPTTSEMAVYSLVLFAEVGEDIFIYDPRKWSETILYRILPNGNRQEILVPGKYGTMWMTEIRAMKNIRGRLYFQTGIESEIQIWKLNDEMRPVLVSEDPTDPIRFIRNFETITVFKDTIYFREWNREKIGYELWKINAKGEPEIVEDNTPGDGLFPTHGTAHGFFSERGTMLDVGGTLYFGANTHPNGSELWRLNREGTAERLKYRDGESRPQILTFGEWLFTQAADAVYFTAYEEKNGFGIWRIGDNGEATKVTAGTGLNPGERFGGEGARIKVGEILFSLGYVNDKQLGLWRIDSADKAHLLKIVSPDLSQHPYADNIADYRFAVANGILYFTADDSTNGKELWRVRGSDRPELINSAKGGLAAGSKSSNPNNLIDVNGRLYFVADDGVTGLKVWTIRDDFKAERTGYDFGDAPSAIQSGFASGFPTWIEDNGARHRVGPLFLGNGIAEERDGRPSGRSDGETRNSNQDDGIRFDQLLLASDSQSITSGFQAVASQTGKLDAWIDFNQDGDWSDSGEKIVDKASLNSGTNQVAFTIPKGVKPGITFARVRLSSAGGLAPTGAAENGEVEDYRVHILSASGEVEVSEPPLAENLPFQLIDLTQAGKQRLNLLDEKVFESLESQSLRLLLDDDELMVQTGWIYQSSRKLDGKWIHRYAKSGSTLEISGQKEIHNFVDRFDVNANGLTEPVDVLIIINQLRRQPTPGEIRTDGMSTRSDWTFCDVSGNNAIEPIDVLQVINRLNRRDSATPSAEGENNQESSLDTYSVDRIMTLDIDSLTETRKRSKRIAGLGSQHTSVRR